MTALLHDDQSWHCLRAQPKHEHIAAAHLRQRTSTEVFNPRLRIRRATRRGPVWFIESVFPTYLFARFADAAGFASVASTPGLRGCLQFGGQPATVPAPVIADLREFLDEQQTVTLAQEVAPGDAVEIAAGPFSGLSAVVQRVFSARQRVQVLLEFLGRPTGAELGMEQLEKPDWRARARVLSSHAIV